MFWQFNHQSSTHIDLLLNKEDVTLQELMDEEDVLQECKVQNKKLIDFLVRQDIMEELVRLTTVEPSSDVDEKQRYKYPNIACELLTSDVPTLNERLAGDEELLGKLYTFLETEKPLNPLLASFFSKTFGVLVARKSEQNWYSYQFTCLQVLEFLKSKENFITLLLNHLGTSAIMDLLLKLITHIEGAKIKQDILDWLDSQQVIQCLVGLIDPTVDVERNCNASQLLCDVIRRSRDNQHTSSEKADPDPILTRVEDPTTVSQLLDHMLGPEKHESSIVGGVMVLLTLLDCSRPNYEGNNGDQVNVYGSGEPQHQEEQVTAESEQSAKVVLTTLEAILPRLKDFHNLLLDPPYKPLVRTTAGILDPPLGNTRLHIAKLLATVIAANHPSINKELAELGTVEALLDLFFKYSWNNFLHSQVEQCLAFALNVEVTEGEPTDELVDNNVLLKNIFINCRLLQRILDAWDDNETQQTKTGGLRKGYMGHLIKIANAVASQVEKGALGAFIKEHVPAETVTAWEEFIASTLTEINKTHSISLGGAHPVHSSSEDDDADYRTIPYPPDSALQQAFSHYQVQQMTPSFTDTYGFRDEEFNEGDDMLHTSVDRLTSMTFGVSEAQAEMFDMVCMQKVHTLEDNDADVWTDHELAFSSAVNPRNAVWQQAGEDEAANSSDEEEEREGPEGREEIHMEVDMSDPWTTGSLASPTSLPAGLVADAGNPWSSADPAAAAMPLPEQGGWADFGTGGFADFEANFTESSLSTDDLHPTQDASGDASLSSPGATTTISLPEPVKTTESSALTPDGNANTTSQPLTDNHRFLQNLESAASGDAGEPGKQEEVRQPDVVEAVENGPVLPAVAVPVDNTSLQVEEQLPPPLPTSKVPEDDPSPSLLSAPNGPV